MLLTACKEVTDDTDVTVPEVSKCFINLSIAVTNSNGTITRGTPSGGENGDGREAGFDRENAVTGITLMLCVIPPVLFLVSLLIFSTKFKLHGSYMDEITKTVIENQKQREAAAEEAE